MFLNSAVRRVLPRRLRPHRILAGPLRGARIVTSWHDYPAGITGRTERALLAWFRAHVKPGETWLDVGAHYGYTAIALARYVGPTGRVFAFEPFPASAGCIAQTGQLNALRQLIVVPFGLGTPETLTCLRFPLERGMADATMTAAPHGWTQALPIARFDWLWPMLNDGIERIDGVKIDVQSMELDVLRGMERMLRRERPKLVVEFHAGVDRAPILELLCRVGYDRNARAIETDETRGELLDNHSYAFMASSSGAAGHSNA